jgi:hypothetical protein
MSDTGPQLHVVPDDDWEDLLRKEKVQAWYHVSKATAPGAFSRGDDIDGASITDSIWAKASVVRAAQQGETWALRLLAHEYLHCLSDWTPTKEQSERLEHPTKALPAILHAFRTRCGLNAFTRVLRWSDKPSREYAEFLTWFRKATALTETPGDSIQGPGSEDAGTGENQGSATCEVEDCPLPPSPLSGICEPHETHHRSCYYPTGGVCSCPAGILGAKHD